MALALVSGCSDDKGTASCSTSSTSTTSSSSSRRRGFRGWRSLRSFQSLSSAIKVNQAAGGSIAELALEAWSACEPEGYVIEEKKLAALSREIVSRIPMGKLALDRDRAKDLGELFLQKLSGEPPIFIQLLKPRGGMVHFLYFWRAFGDVSRLAGATPDEGLVAELETVRARLLRRMEEESATAAGAPPQSFRNWFIKGPTLAEEAQIAAKMSVCPRFWNLVADTLADESRSEVMLDLEELTVLFLEWLRSAPVWEQPAWAESGLSRSESLTGSEASAGSKSEMVVRLHIYDVSQEESIQKFNGILAHRKSPLKLGGIFHAGVEINGLEWSFGCTESETKPGIVCVEPKQDPQHHYRQTVSLRKAKVSAEEVEVIIRNMIEEYPGHTYDLLRRNCCHFADDLCRRLGVGGIPGWVHRLARVGARVDNLLHVMPRD